MLKNWKSVRGLNSNSHRETIEHVFSNSEKSTFQARILDLSKPLTRPEANRVSIREGQISQLVRAGHGGFCLTLSSTVFHWLWF